MGRVKPLGAPFALASELNLHKTIQGTQSITLTLRC